MIGAQDPIHGQPDRWEERTELVAQILKEFRETARFTRRGRPRPKLVEALLVVPRHEFVPAGERSLAYGNHPLPIGHDQTISQPYIVALMTDLLEPEPSHAVLEIGTGSGYQAAVLSRLVARVFSIEVVEELADSARKRLADLGYANVEVKAGNGADGWPERAPFDGIIVTAGARAIPPKLIAQLKPGGRIVMPLGSPGDQMLIVGRKRDDGTIEQENVLPVAFVPFIGAE